MVAISQRPLGSPLWPAVLVLIAVVAGYGLFQSGIDHAVGRWIKQEEYNHGFLCFAVSLFLIWWRRHDLSALPYKPTWIGPALVLVSIAFALVGKLAALFIMTQAALFTCLVGLALSLWGWASLRLLIMPLVITAAAIPLPYFIESAATFRLQLFSSAAGVAILQALGYTAHNDGNLIDMGVYGLSVVEACSGLRYMFPLIGLSLIIAYLYRGPMWQRVLLVVAAAPISVLMNVLRIAFTGVMVEWKGPEAADGFIHWFEGWVIFLSSTIILLGLIWALNRFLGYRKAWADVFGLEPPMYATPQGAGFGVGWPRHFGLSALIAVGAGTLFAVANRAEIIPDRQPLALFPLSFNDWEGQSSSLSSWEQEALGNPDHTMITYLRPDESLNLFIAYYPSQRQGVSPHSPRVCIPGGGWQISSLDRRTVEAGGKTLPINRVVIEKGRDRQLVYYWFEQRGRQIADEYQMKLWLLRDSIVERRTDGALVRLVTLLPPNERIETADKRLEQFIQLSYPKIQEFVPQ
jgi:exosortase D (VPLPA-CTERM-specific)